MVPLQAAAPLVRRALIALLALLALLACRPAGVINSGETVPGPWEIRTGSVGPFTLGAAIPAAHLDGAEAAYFARYIADGQPFEGFTFDGVDVAIRGGPFAAWDRRQGPGDPPVAALREEAVRRARGGAKVSWLLVRGEAHRTAQGPGVGSSLAELEAAWGDAGLRALPPTYGDDLCSAQPPALPGVSFVFASCDAAGAGAPVLRVDVWSD